MILYVLRYWPTLTETFAHDEIRALRARGERVELAACDPREGPDTDPPAPVHRRPHRWGWLRALPALVVEWARRPAWESPRVLWLASLARRAERVHVHFAGDAAAWAARACARAGVPWTVTVHAVDLYRPRPDLGSLLRAAARVVTVAEANRGALRERYGVDAVVVRCGVELPPPVEAEPGLVVCVARDVPKKGLDTLLSAWRAVPAGRLVLVSDRPDPKLERVTVTGLLPHAAALSWIRRASLVVLPARVAPDGDRDGVPVVLLEALAARRPVVTTAVGGIPEVVDEAVGWVIPPRDPVALARTLQAALADPAEAARRGARGPQRLRERGFLRDDAIQRLRAVLRGPSGW